MTGRSVRVEMCAVRTKRQLLLSRGERDCRPLARYLGLHRALKISRKCDEGLGPTYAREDVKLREKVLQCICVRRPHLEDDARIASNRVNFLDLWESGQTHHSLTFAPTIRIDMNEC